MVNEEESVEWKFFMYAFPCTHLKVERGVMDEEEFRGLESLFLQKKAPTKSRLLEVYQPAIERVRELAKRIGKDTWDTETIDLYWSEEHNRILEEERGIIRHLQKMTDVQVDLCKIHRARVAEKREVKGERFLIVEYDDKRRAVKDSIVPDAEIGDYVTIHYAYAIEKVS